MRKIVFLQKTDMYSGAENIVITIMRMLPGKEYQCIYVSPDGEIRKFVEAEGLAFYPLKDSSLKSIRKAMTEIQPDIIHATDYGMSSYASKLKLGIPVVAHLHNNAPWLKNPLHPKNIIFTLSLPYINSVISVSKSIEDEFVHKGKILEKNHTIYNVVDLSRVKALADEEDDISENYDIVFLGRLVSQKNPLLFCEIIKHIQKVQKNVKAVMIGDGELKSEVDNYITEKNLKENISLLGFQKNPYKYVKKSKLLLMPSNYEGFGLAAVEGLSLGKPVVCSGVGGLKDVITGECGAICTSIEDYVDEIERLFVDNNYYEHKSQNAIKRAQKFGNINEYINQIIEVYDECLSGKKE